MKVAGEDTAVGRLRDATRRLAEETQGRVRTGRSHQDADDVTGTASTALTAAFASVSASLADEDGAPLRCEPAAFRLPKVLYRSPAASGDCCTPALPWGELPVADFIARCHVANAAGFRNRYLTRADLTLMRRAAGRTKDLRRASELEQLAQPEASRQGRDRHGRS